MRAPPARSQRALNRADIVSPGAPRDNAVSAHTLVHRLLETYIFRHATPALLDQSLKAINSNGVHVLGPCAMRM